MTAPRKTPQDHKRPASEPFVYECSAGTLSLPRFSELPFGLLRKMRHEDENEIAFFLFENLLDAEGLAVVDALPQSEIGELIEAWQADSEVSAPESSAS